MISLTGAETRVAARLFRNMLQRLVWILPLAVIGIAVIITLLNRGGGEPAGSIWQYAGTAAPWFLFALGVVFTTADLPVHVAFGGTRRSFLRGSHAAALLGALVVALLLILGFSAERAVYSSLGWTLPVAEETPALIARAAEVGGVPLGLLAWTLLLLVFSTTGSIIGTMYYRFGPLYATPLLLSTLPLWLAQVLANGWNLPGSGLRTDSLPMFFLGSLLLFGAALLGNWLLLRSVPIRKQR